VRLTCGQDPEHGSTCSGLGRIRRTRDQAAAGDPLVPISPVVSRTTLF
jgi:hypothetical protein